MKKTSSRSSKHSWPDAASWHLSQTLASKSPYIEEPEEPCEPCKPVRKDDPRVIAFAKKLEMVETRLRGEVWGQTIALVAHCLDRKLDLTNPMLTALDGFQNLMRVERKLYARMADELHKSVFEKDHSLERCYHKQLAFFRGLVKAMEKMEVDETRGELVSLTNSALISFVLAKHTDEFDRLLTRGATIEQLAWFIVGKLPGGHAVRLKKHFTANKDAFDEFRSYVSKICRRLGVPLRSRGRPRKK